jgi:hypothetical protein
MKTINTRILALTLVSASLSLGSLQASAQATPDFTVPFEAGVACSFPLTIEGTNAKGISTEYTDKDGNLNVWLTGKGYAFRYTNTTTGKSTTTKSQPAAQHTITYPDGSQRITTYGASLIVMFPTDIPAGPTTKYYNGVTDMTITAQGVGTLIDEDAYGIDICHVLSRVRQPKLGDSQ